jgi:hypothetical protein
MFTYDWWHGSDRAFQIDQARLRCVQRRFAEVTSLSLPEDSEAGRFLAELEVHTVIYLRDGFSYEVSQIIDAPTKSSLVCEVIPMEEAWRVGGFVVTLPFEDVVRVEIFAIHPAEKPHETPHITGFRAMPPEGTSREPAGS